MTDASYSWFYEDPFHTVFLTMTTVLSVTSNGLLLLIIRTSSASNMGRYRHLLAVFAVCDVMTTLGHTLFQPRMHMTTTGFYFFPRHGGNVVAGYPLDTGFALTFIATYYQTFLILAFHFVYRYKTVARGIDYSFTDNWTHSQWMAAGVIAYILYIAGFIGTCGIAFTPAPETRALIPQEILDIYGIDLHDINRGFTVISVRRPDNVTGQMLWHWPSVVGLLMLLGMFGGTASVIVYCIYRTSSIVRSFNNQLDTQSRKMHTHLFEALLIQSFSTAIPVIFSYLPLATVLMFPAITGISLGAFGNVLFSITSIFPSIDAFFVLFFIARFRATVIRMFTFGAPKVVPLAVGSQDSRTVGTSTVVSSERAVEIVLH